MRLEIQCEDRIGMIHEILDLFIPHRIDVRLIEIDSKQRCIYCGFPDISFSQLQTLLAEIRRLDSVEDVKTVMFTPSEREHNALYTLLESLSDGVISVDLKGQVTMATEQAAEDLSLPITELLHRPISQIIKGIHLSKLSLKEPLAKPAQSTSKRVRIRGKTFLLEMKPIFVCDDDGVQNVAGTVIYLKSELRLDKQKARLNQASKTESLDNAEATPNTTLINGSLEQTVKHWEAELLRRLYPEFPSSRRLAKAVGMSHSTIANKLKEYGIGVK